MRFRKAVLATLAWLAACSFIPAPVTLADAPRLNVLLITADDLGPQLSCYGDTTIQTPCIDALAVEAARFRVAYVAQASCSPSRASIFTGLFPHTHGHIGLTKPRNPIIAEPYRSQTMPVLLAAAGYRTGLIGKLHVDPAEAFPFDMIDHGKKRPEGMRGVRWIADEAAAFIASSAGRPFFLMVNYGDPHRLDGGFPAQADGLPEQPLTAADVRPWPFQALDGARQLTDIANYYNSVRRLDAGVGLLLDGLRRSGHDRDTLVVFLGDHGPPFARGKTSCYEAGLRVPLIVRWPGVSRAGLASDALASATDILPTVLDAAGVAIPAHIQGRSLRQAVSTPSSAAPAGWRTTLAGEFHMHGESPFFPRRAIRNDRYKIIHNLLAGRAKPSESIDGDPAQRLVAAEEYRGTAAAAALARLADPPEWELYDLTNDPWEFTNLAADPAHAGTLARMQAALADWRRVTADPFLDAAALERQHAASNGAGQP